MERLAEHCVLDPDRLPRPFSLGLKAVRQEHWLKPDERLPNQLRQKHALFLDKRDAVFREEAITQAAQAELLAMLLDYLPEHYPEFWKVSGNSVTIVPTDTTYDIEHYSDRRLELASRLVQDDLVILRKGDAGYRVAAAAVCFPSTWVLAEKFGKAIADVHGPVPGFERGTRMAMMIDRIFDNLGVGEIVERRNWSIYETPRLHHPASHSSHSRWEGKQDRLLLDSFIRGERQTIRRLPQSGDLVFTIQIMVEAANKLKAHPERGEIAYRLQNQIASLNDDQLAYKGLTGYREAVLAELEELQS